MKTLLSLSRVSKKALSVCIFALAVFTVFFNFTPEQKHEAQIVYHTSQWNEYAPEIERALEKKRAVRPLSFGHVYGGVVSHHVPTTIARLVEFYSRLKKTQTVKNFIVIGPDHTDAGQASITVSDASFFTKYGEVKPIEGIAGRLQDAQLAVIDESPFSQEHSIGSQVLIISRLFPGAHVTPIIFRSDVGRDHAGALGKMLTMFLDDETVLIASVDFSHYLSTDQAMPLDTVSAEVVRSLDVEAFRLVEADSNQAMAVFMKAMREKGAFETEDITVSNTNDLMQNSDYTTGYVFGFWGAKTGLWTTSVTIGR